MALDSKSHVDEWIGVYALDALSPGERRVIEQHLKGCARCRSLARQAQATADILARAVEPVMPSPDLKRNLFARVDADLARSRVGRNPFASLFANRPRALAFAAALVLLIAVGLGTLPRTTSLPTTSAAPSNAQAQIISLPRVPLAMLTVSGLRPLGSDQTYELWLIRGDKPVPAGTFNVDAQGNGQVWVRADEPVGNFEQAGITIEKAGGSEVPDLNALVFVGALK